MYSHIKKVLFVAVGFLMFGSAIFLGNHTALAAISSGSITCNSSADCLAGAGGTNMNYAVSFSTNTSANASLIRITFPSGYSLPIGAGAVNIFTDTTFSIPGIRVNGINTTVSSTSVSAQNLTINLNTMTNLSAGSVVFYIRMQNSGSRINPTTTGTTGTFTITTDAPGETAQSNVAGVTILSPYTNAHVSGVSAADLYSGASPVSYQVSLDAASVAAGAMSITVTFPTGYSITQGTISPNTICSDSSCGMRGSISTNAGPMSLSSVSGSGNTLSMSLSIFNTINNISFAIMAGDSASAFGSTSARVTNPSTLGVTGTFPITVRGVSTDTNAPGVTITTAPNHLVFSTQVDCSSENDAGKCISGTAFSGQPVVTVKDYTNAVDTSYNGDITAYLFSGSGTLSGTDTVTAVNGVATFTNLNYHSGSDNESFVIGATATDGGGPNETGMTNGNSNSIVSDIVATKFTLIDSSDDSGGIITVHAGTNPTFFVTATDADGTQTDTDYDATGKTFTFKDAATALLSTHVSPNGATPTIPTSAGLISHFSGGSVTLSDMAGNPIGFAKAEVLGPITVSDGTLSGDSDPVHVLADSTTTFGIALSTLTPTSGVPFTMTVTAEDQYGNILNSANTGGQPFGYSGEGVQLVTTASGPYNFSPFQYYFQPSDQGVKTFINGVTLNAVENGVSVGAQRTGGTTPVYQTGVNVQSAAPTGGGTTVVVSGGGGGGGGGGGYTAPAPVGTPFLINGGAATTVGTNVSLTFYVPNKNQLEVSNNSSFTGASWILYTTPLSWTLTSGAGAKTVYVKFKDIYGLETSPLSQSITLTTDSASVSSTGCLPGYVFSATTGLACGSASSSSVTTASSSNPDASVIDTLAPFLKNLQKGSDSDDVARLQHYLNTHGAVVAESGFGSLGNEVTTFGAATLKALIRYQKAHGIAPSIGYFGPTTRGYVNAHLN